MERSKEIFKYMKRIFNWVWKKAINFFKWVWRECRNWQTIVLLAFVCVVVGAPVWVCGLLGFLFNWAWAWTVFFALLAFWWLPGMPYFAVCVSITLVIKRIFGKYKRKKIKAEKEAAKLSEEESAQDSPVDDGESKENNE